MRSVQGLSSIISLRIPNAVLGPLLVAAVSLLTACGGGGGDDAKVLRVQGAVNAPVEYSAAQVQAASAPITQTVTFAAGTTPQTHTYIGTGTWSLLNLVGITLDATKKNDVLNRYVLASGSDGYRVAFSLGELSPDFGNVSSVIAYQETTAGLTSPLSTDGPVRITAPGDVKGGRYVSNLDKLDLRSSGSTAASTIGGPSTSFTLSGSINTPATYTATALRALPVTTLIVGTSTYTGVSLWTLLNTTAGLRLDSTIKNPSLSMLAVATGSDGYKALVTLGEIDPGFGNRPAIIAYAVNGASLGTSGDTRLIVGNDVKQGRSVSNLVAIEVITAAASDPR